jgi:hypothetical protein
MPPFASISDFWFVYDQVPDRVLETEVRLRKIR